MITCSFWEQMVPLCEHNIHGRSIPLHDDLRPIYGDMCIPCLDWMLGPTHVDVLLPPIDPIYEEVCIVGPHL